MRTTSMQGIRKSGKALAVVGAAVLLGGLTAACGSDGDGGSASDTAVTEDVLVEEQSSSDSGGGESNARLIESAIGGGYSAKCDFTDAESKTEGSMYIMGEQNFYLTANSPEGEVRMLQDLEKLYMWGPGTEMAVSIDTSIVGNDPGEESLSPADLQDTAAIEGLDCERYSGDMSIFAAPTDVQFVAFDEMLSGALDPELLEGMLNGDPSGGN